MNNLLPMTYSIRLFKEALVSIETSLLSKNLIIVTLIFIFFLGVNLTHDFINQNKYKKLKK